ncbi:magnesium transporter MRS2-11, chloroplastic-like isoform X2 [Chenopodium quinoa]|uniref:magnesium transporter MRS2-11, chloroplastic-like isoform X2 n=1 Tax=Chenopodium quinoa TaxID=63459 RepID=UPI000B799A8A|nr:magnesium transporter MRS2-11, chloroplastic-like isoform X2 [Chenopodium quinoa]
MFPATTTSSPPPHSLFSIPPSHLFSDLLLLRPPCSTPPSLSLHRNFNLSVAVKYTPKSRCFAKSTAEDQISDSETRDDSSVVDFDEREIASNVKVDHYSGNDVPKVNSPPPSPLGIPEPVYQVVEVKSDGMVSTKTINRRNLLKTSGLRPRDIRSVDPSLWLTNSMPSLLVREHAILLNLGSLRAIVMQERVLIFNYNRRGGKAFIDSLLPRLKSVNTNGVLSMPFVLEVVEAALVSRIQRYEQRMMEIEPRVQSLLEVLPNRLTGDILEQLRTSKQTLVELGSRAGDLRQMLLDLLEDTQELRRICIMGRNCTVDRITHSLECSVPLDKDIAEEEEEIEMLLENYLQRCESIHGQAERLLDSAKEMEDSIAVNLSSRRLEVSKVELLLQVGTFCVAIGALIAGIFGMNLRSYLEEHVFAFWTTTAGIMIGIVVGFYLMYVYLKKRKIL